MKYMKTVSTRADPTISRISFGILLSSSRSVRPHCGHMSAANDFLLSPGLSWCDTPGFPVWCPGFLFGTATSGSSPLSFARYLLASRLNFLRSFAYPVASEE